MLQNLSSAAVVIGALRVNSLHAALFCMPFSSPEPLKVSYMYCNQSLNLSVCCALYINFFLSMSSHKRHIFHTNEKVIFEKKQRNVMGIFRTFTVKTKPVLHHIFLCRLILKKKSTFSKKFIQEHHHAREHCTRTAS